MGNGGEVVHRMPSISTPRWPGPDGDDYSKARRKSRRRIAALLQSVIPHGARFIPSDSRTFFGKNHKRSFERKVFSGWLRAWMKSVGLTWRERIFIARPL